MNRLPFRAFGLLAMVVSAACGDGSGPTAPAGAGPQPFLAGTWKGTVTIRVNPGEPGVPAPMSGATTWTFEVVPQTNNQTFQATVQSAHPWLPTTMTAMTALAPGN